MNAGGKVTPAVIASLMGHERGTLALDRYSSGASQRALVDAVADLGRLGFSGDVVKALEETASQRPRMVRIRPVVVEPVTEVQRPRMVRRKAVRVEATARAA